MKTYFNKSVYVLLELPDGTKEETYVLSTELLDEGRIIRVSGQKYHWIASFDGSNPTVKMFDPKTKQVLEIQDIKVLGVN